MPGVWPTWPPPQNWTCQVRDPNTFNAIENKTKYFPVLELPNVTQIMVLKIRVIIWSLFKLLYPADCKPEVAMAMLRWVYTDELELTEDDAFLIDLMKLANRFQLQVLRERSVDVVKAAVSDPVGGTCWSAFVCALRQVWKGCDVFSQRQELHPLLPDSWGAECQHPDELLWRDHRQPLGKHLSHCLFLLWTALNPFRASYAFLWLFFSVLQITFTSPHHFFPHF